MIAAMSISRMLAAGAHFAIGAVLVSVPACIVANDFENGADCLRDAECASKQCTASKCVAQNGDSCQTDERCPPSAPDGKGHCDNGHCRASSAVVDSGTTPADTDTPSDANDASGDAGKDGSPDATDATDAGADGG